MSVPTQLAGQKRKAAVAGTMLRTSVKKRHKDYDTRSIATETADAALSRNGELNIASFIKAREFEINALDKSMRKARQALSTRAFQSVPRHMRRRTASHNAKKVPRRLQKRAQREMLEDNTPTITSKAHKPSARLRLRLETAKSLKTLNLRSKKARQRIKETKINAKLSDPAEHVSAVRVPRIKKNTLAEPPRATSKFKRRQVSKTWLPTHMWHTKRAHMTRPAEPLWRMAIPISPTEKVYRPTHRAANSRGCIAWDMSYMSTAACRGTGKALLSLLKSLHFHGEGWSGPRYQKWIAGSRFSHGWVASRDNRGRLIAPIEVIWSGASVDKETHATSVETDSAAVNGAGEFNAPRKKAKLDHQILVRVHPSAFLVFWLELIKVAKMQKPQVLVEDLRFDIGSIEIAGPGSTEALVGILRSSEQNSLNAKVWSSLSGVMNASSFPLNALVALNVVDPRLNYPPKTVKESTGDVGSMAGIEALANWPLDQNVETSFLFDQRARYLASKTLSQKAVNRRKSTLLPCQSLQQLPGDNSIPIILCAQRSASGALGAQGSWTLLAPWKCIDSIWRSLLYYPLSTGGTPRFGGLQETQQIAFEQRFPWFPNDFPGTQAGQAWERTQSERAFDKWLRRPPSRRLAFTRTDLGLGRRGEIGRGWACDWEALFDDTTQNKNRSKKESRSAIDGIAIEPIRPVLTQRQRRAAKAIVVAKKETSGARRNTSSPEPDSDGNEAERRRSAYSSCFQTLKSDSVKIVKDMSTKALPSEACLSTVRLTMLGRGTPARAARIYRLPRLMSTQVQTGLSIATASDSVPAMQSASTPPGAQPSPLTLSSMVSPAPAQDLRTRWLELAAQTPSQHHPVGKLKTNRHSLPPKQMHLPVPSLNHINVLPKNAPQEVIDMYGPKPLTEDEIRARAEAELAIKVEEERIWDAHIPCPDSEDLLGFVTSGGYNLALGTGTAVGSIWLQRLVEGWREEDELETQRQAEQSGQLGDNNNNDDMVKEIERPNTATGITKQPQAPKSPSSNAAGAKPNPTSQKSAQTKKQIKPKPSKDHITRKQQDCQRHLCIIRNAGDSIGRLATWEFC